MAGRAEGSDRREVLALVDRARTGDPVRDLESEPDAGLAMIRSTLVPRTSGSHLARPRPANPILPGRSGGRVVRHFENWTQFGEGRLEHHAQGIAELADRDVLGDDVDQIGRAHV